MAYDEELAERVRERMAARRGVEEKKMFGGIAFLVDGKMACGVNGDSLMVRVPPDEHDRALAEPGARVMDFTGRPMKGFLFVGAPGLDGDGLDRWVNRSADHVATLPAKTPKKRNPRA